MSKLIVRNATPSSITVSGFTVYNIKSENSTFIVEVEGTSNTAPSVGDIITFGNYPQATSTPEPIEWKVLEVDTTNQKALLIAKKVLDGKTYGAYSENTRWSNCSLREWLNSTFKTTAFDSSEQERIILSHIQNPNNSSTATPGGVDTDDYLFCLSIGEANNTSYFSNREARKGYATQHAIDAGVSVSSGRADWWLRSPGNYNIRAAYVYNSGGVNVSGIEVYENYGVRPALWIDYSQPVRFKAFKYTFNGISYYYIIDGIHNFWTDDLSSIGYSEVPSVVLPTVTNRVCDSAASEGATGWWPGNNTVYSSGTAIPYDESKSYSFQMYRSSSSTAWTFTTILSARSYNGNLSAYNTSSDVLTVRQASYAECSSNQTVEVQVYNSSNVAYNAFKFTASGTDYYYVLDGTQTDWTDDLASIGYHIEILVYFTVQGSNETSNTSMSSGRTYALYDASGNLIPWIDSIPDDGSYTITKFYNSQGQYVSYGTLIILKTDGYIYGRCNGNKSVFSGVLVIP